VTEIFLGDDRAQFVVKNTRAAPKVCRAKSLWNALGILAITAAGSFVLWTHTQRCRHLVEFQESLGTRHLTLIFDLAAR
jgi:hypothetical protein